MIYTTPALDIQEATIFDHALSSDYVEALKNEPLIRGYVLDFISHYAESLKMLSNSERERVFYNRSLEMLATTKVSLEMNDDFCYIPDTLPELVASLLGLFEYLYIDFTVAS